MKNIYKDRISRWKNKNLFKISMCVCISLLVIVAVLGGCKIARVLNESQYDDSIIGSEYKGEALVLPTAEPTPEPTPTPTPTPEATEPKEIKTEYTGAYQASQGDKTAYLTFDDGPTANVTPKILDVLKEKDVKATFFVLGKMMLANPEVAQRAVSEGHILANHSFSHDYKTIYSTEEAFLGEIKRAEEIIINTVGEEGYTRVFRFPGGSFNKDTKFKEKLNEIDYVYVDWNALNGDAEGHNVSVSKQIQNINETIRGKNNIIVLMHDASTKQTTADALAAIIDVLRENGYTFKTLKRD